MSTELGYVKYHSKICDEIRSRFVECRKRKYEIDKQLLELTAKISDYMDGNINLTYKEYLDTKNTIERLHREERELNIKIGVWDEAREICLDVIYGTDEN